MLNRRDAIWLGSAALLAGCGGTVARRGPAGDVGDLPILGTALELERAQMAAYQRGIALARGERRALIEKIYEHERSHAEALAQAIRDLDGKVPAARSTLDYAETLPPMPDYAAFRRAAIELEQRAVTGYTAALPKLRNRRLRATLGSILTVEAEHAQELAR